MWVWGAPRGPDHRRRAGLPPGAGDLRARFQDEL